MIQWISALLLDKPLLGPNKMIGDTKSGYTFTNNDNNDNKIKYRSVFAISKRNSIILILT